MLFLRLDVQPGLFVVRLPDAQNAELVAFLGRDEAEVEVAAAAPGRSNPLSDGPASRDVDSPARDALEFRGDLNAVEVWVLRSERATLLFILTEVDLPELVPGAPAVEGEPDSIWADVPASVLLGAAVPTAEVREEFDGPQGQLLASVGLNDGRDVGDVSSQHSSFPARMAIPQCHCGKERHGQRGAAARLEA